jgi:hypothetical protein
MIGGGSSSDTETQLLVLETDAKLDALRQARKEVQDFGVDVEKMSQRSRAAWESYSAAEKRAVAGFMGTGGPPGAGGGGASAAGAAAARASAQLQTRDAAGRTAEVNRAIGAYLERGKVVDKTSAQAVAAYRREGDALAANLARMGAMEKELNAIGAAAQRVERQSGAISAGGGNPPGVRNAGAGFFRGTVPGTGEEFARISPRVLTAANALTTFSLAATASNGSAQSMIMSLGMMATSISMVSNSARLAAAATGIGALVVVLGAASEMLDRFISKAPQAQAAMEKIGGARNAQQAQQYVDQIDMQIKALNKQLEEGNFVQRAQASAQIQALYEVRTKAVSQAVSMQHDETQRTLEEQRRKHKQELDEEKRHREEMAKETIASAERITAARVSVMASQAGRDTGLADPEGAAERIRIAADTQRRLREIDRNELLDTRQKEEERRAIIEEGEEAIANSRSKSAKKAADEDLKKREEAKRAQLAIARTAASEIIRSQDSLTKALKRAAIEPIVTWLEGTAAQELVAAARHAASLDFFGAARHAGVAALAIAAGRRLAGLAGLGGGGGASGGGGGNQGTFTPAPSATGSGNTTINLYTRNPYGEDAIAETLYYTNRADILKKPPLQIPPTTGFQNRGSTGRAA